MTPAVQAVRKAAVRFELHDIDVDAARDFGRRAADALSVPVARVFKTLIVKLDTGALAVALVSADAELDLKSLAAVAGAKRAEMADPRDAERSTGYVVGGISPLGQRRRLTTFIDTAAMQHETVFISGGRRGLEIELAPRDLAALCEATVGVIARSG